MTKDDIIQLIRDRLGFNDNIDEGIVLRHMNYFQAQYETGEAAMPPPWFLFDADVTASTVIAQPYVDFPEDFVAWDDNWLPWVVDDEGNNHPLNPTKAYQTEGHNESAALPTDFGLAGKKVRLYPTPDKVYTVHLPCYKSSEALSVAATSPWFENFPTLVIEETLLSIAKSTRDVDAIKLSTAREERAAYFAKVEDMKHVLMSYVKGSYDGA